MKKSFRVEILFKSLNKEKINSSPIGWEIFCEALNYVKSPELIKIYGIEKGVCIEMDFRFLPGDQIFSDSPDVGTPECICSGCKEKIGEGDIPFRIWPSDTREYRFCEKCTKERTKGG